MENGKDFQCCYISNRIFKRKKLDKEYWIKTIPWEEELLDGAIKSASGQDVPRLATLFNGLSPMTFSHELKRSLDWKKKFLNNLKNATNKKIVTYVQIRNLSS